MPLAQRHRTKLPDTLAPLVGDDTIEALLAEFPATDLDRPASQAFVRAEIAELGAKLSADVHALDVTISERLRQLTMWFTSALIASVTASTAVAAVIARLVG